MKFMGNSNIRRVAFLALFCAAFAETNNGYSQSTGILREVWTGIGGTDIPSLTNDPRFPDNPDFDEVLPDFEAPTDVLDNYGQRLRGFVVPPVSGNYTFWIAGDDNCELWLSTDDDPLNASRIASVPGWTSSREWGKYTEQQSSPVSLAAGSVYYVEALMKEGGGGDNLAVRWRRPDGADEGPIPGEHLLPWGTVFEPPTIGEQPADTSVVEGQIAHFSVAAATPTPVTVEWRLNGVVLPGETGLELSYGPVSLADDGAKFTAVLSNDLGSAPSDEATLSVTPDVTKPVVLKAINLGADRIRITFSEPVEAASALTTGNYQVSGGVSISGAIAGSSSNEVELSVSGLTFGAEYTVTINDVRDQAQTPNTIQAGSTVSFFALQFVAQDIGASGGAIEGIGAGAFDVTGGGAGLSSDGDELQFAWEERTGNFDVQVRVADVGISNPFVRAGMMARESLDESGRFAAIFASSAQVGSFFESRVSNGGNITRQSIPGGFPANYPQTWLRLRRVGNAFTGFASVDGQTWTQLGSASISLPSKILLGLAVTSLDASTTTARFRDFGDTASQSVGTFVNDSESLTPSSRRTGLIFSEIMYRTKAVEGSTANLEFIEVFNAGAIFEDLTGWKITGGVDFAFPDGYKLEAGQFVVVAADPGALESASGITGALGPFDGALNNGGERLQLRDSIGAIKLDLEYSPDAPWPVAADGAGHSLVLAAPSYGEADPRAWSASAFIGGSPGRPDPVLPSASRSVVINEFLAHTDDPQLDFVELYNRSNTQVDLSGFFLSDDPDVNRFRIPDGTTIAARGFVSFDQNELGFALSSAGEAIYLVSADETRVVDAVRFGGQENGVSSGRLPNGSETIRRLASPTPGAANTAWMQEPVVFNELMYAPISGDSDDEYIELYNRTSEAVDLSGWRLREGVEFDFPEGTTIPGGGFLVVAKDAAKLLSNYSQLNAGNTLGDYSRALGNAGERIVLDKPDEVVSVDEFGNSITDIIHIIVADLTYADGGRWGRWADGGGSSLELIDPDADIMRAANWRDSDETSKAEWSQVEFTGRLDNGNGRYGINRLFLGLLNDGECLVDDIELVEGAGSNLVSNGGFESGTSGWTFFGNHVDSTVETGGAFSGNRSLHVRAGGGLDTGPNSIRTSIGSSLSNNDTATIRARVRWLAGWPELLFRIRGNYLDYAAPLPVPANLGTPGQKNSRLVNNAGPAIYDVTHTPALPRSNQSVVVTARVSDPDGVGSINLRYRTDPSTTLSTVAMRDDGTLGDAVAGDGLYSARISGRSSDTLIGFRIEAADGAAATATFPESGATDECLIHWGDPVPLGSFPNVYLWTTQANRNAADGNQLNNQYRTGTLVYGNKRVIYNALFRDKGSPYHAGGGDIAMSLPKDDKLHGARERLFASTGNGGSEATGLRGRLAAWLGKELGIPYLQGNYERFYINGGEFRNIVEDLEEPDHDYAEQNFPGGSAGDLYKLSIWFEFADNNRDFNSTQTTLEEFTTLGNELKITRYRWNWERRARVFPEDDYTTVFNLVEAANAPDSVMVDQMLGLADVEEWMRVHAYNRITGNWDAWTFNVGQNMYLFQQPGRRAVIMPWDIDFVFGLGNGSSDGLWGGQDPVGNRMYDTPAFRRMLWRAYIDAVNGPMLESNYGPVIQALRSAQEQNNIDNLGETSSINSYINARRNFILGQIASQDNGSFAITSNGGGNFTTASPVVQISGTAPFAVATIEINGVAYPVEWTGFNTWRVEYPLGAGANALEITGHDLNGNPIDGASDSVTITYNGEIELPEDHLVINEIMYHSLAPDADFVEIYNTSTTHPFDLSGYELNGADFTFADGTLIEPGAYLLVVENQAAFIAAYGTGFPIAGEYNGRLENNGETISLIKRGETPDLDVVIDEVSYDDDLPWPGDADGLGASLQLINPASDNRRVANWASVLIDQPQGGTETLLDFTSQWRYFQSGDPGSGWDEPGFNDGGWPSGAGLLYVEDAALPAPKNTPLTLGRDTYFFRTTFNVDDPNNVELTAQTILDDGAIVYLNGDEWFRVGVPDGESGSGVFANRTVGDAVIESVPDVATSSPVAGENVVAVEVHQHSNDSSDVVWGLQLTATATGAMSSTPGAANLTGKSAPNLPTVWLNEVQPENLSGPTDGQGDHDAWVELYNSGEQAVSLSGYHLASDYSNLRQWAFPTGASIAAGQYRVVWLDGETTETSGSEYHANFVPDPGDGSVVLTRTSGDSDVVVDYLNYSSLSPDRSYGAYPDGKPNKRRFFINVTPGSENDPTSPRIDVFINEWLADNSTTNADPADDQFEDWFELFNAGTTTVDLSGYYLTDDPLTPTMFEIPAGTMIPEGGYLLVWADDDPSQNDGSSVHTTFKLGKTGDMIALVAPDLSVADSVEFLEQASDVSEGRSPDGAAAPFASFDVPTPGASNTGNPAENTAPVLDFIGNRQVDEGAPLVILVTASDSDVPAQSLTFSLGDGAPAGAVIDSNAGVFAWTPGEADGPGEFSFAVTVTDDGSPALSDSEMITISVAEVNSAPMATEPDDRSTGYSQTVEFTISATDADVPAQNLNYSLIDGPAGASIDADSGAFTWTPTVDQVGEHDLNFEITDDGSPAKSVSVSVHVTVRNDDGTLRITEITWDPDTGGSLSWAATPGVTYVVEEKEKLDASQWVEVARVTATGDSESVSGIVDSGAATGFFRIRIDNQ